MSRNLFSAGEGWTITFCFDGWYAKQVAWQMRLSDRQRVVVMAADGTHVIMAHEDLRDDDPRLKHVGGFDDRPPLRQIGEEHALHAAIEYTLRNGFVAGYANNPERDWVLPADRSAPVRAVPRLLIDNNPCATVPRNLRSGGAGWSIGFCYDVGVMLDRRIPLPSRPRERLRFVTMDQFGEGIDMSDEDGDWGIVGLRKLREPPACTAPACSE
jgi:hypothetical protein